MNKYVGAVIRKIDIDEHLAHYQKMSRTQRVRLLTYLFMSSQKFKVKPHVAKIVERESQKKFTPEICKNLLKDLK